MKLINDDLWLCEDCTMAAVNDDYTGLDYAYSKEEAEARMEDIIEGLAELPGLVPMDGEDEFSTRACDCCGTPLGGRRHRFGQLGKE